MQTVAVLSMDCCTHHETVRQGAHTRAKASEALLYYDFRKANSGTGVNVLPDYAYAADTTLPASVTNWWRCSSKVNVRNVKQSSRRTAVAPTTAHSLPPSAADTVLLQSSSPQHSAHHIYSSAVNVRHIKKRREPMLCRATLK